MNKRDLAQLMAFASTLDARVPFDEAAVYAWAIVVAENMDAAWAGEFVKRHYATTNDMLVPSTLNKAWKDRQRAIPPEVGYAHCQRGGCVCTHTEPCFKGWMDRPDNTATVPCATCRPSLAKVLREVAPLGLRGEHDHAQIRNRFQE